MSAGGELPGMWEEADLSGGWADTDGMSARDQALDLLGKILPREHAQAYRELFSKKFDAHAHELAEKQRAHLRSEGYEPDCICESCSGCLASEYIDLIDPRAGV